MDKRRHERKKKRILIRMNGKPAVLQDISRSGIQLTCATIPGERKVEISIKYEDKTFDLSGLIRWVRRQVTFHSPKNIGISLIRPPKEYLKFIDNL